jgi:hypothetical protein
MNHLTKEQLDKYKLIAKKRFGVELSDIEALDQAQRLLKIMQVIYRPIPINPKYGTDKPGS